MARRGARGEGSCYQREQDGRWVATLPLGYDGFGRRIRKAFYGTTQKEALAGRKQFARDLEEGLVPTSTAKTPKAHTVASWLDYWLTSVVQAEREPTTYESYETTIRLHIKPHIGAIALKDLTVDHLEHWLKILKARDVGLRTRQVAVTRLRTALNFGLRRRQQTGMRYNAATLVAMPSDKSEGKRRAKVPPPNLDHARALLDAARGNRLEAIITVGLALGLRRGEVIGLRWEDIDMDARIMKIRRRVSRVKGRLLVREGVKMGEDEEGAVALPDLLIHALAQHRTRQLLERMKAGPRWKGPEPSADGKPSGFVFTSMVGTVLEPRNVYRTFEDIRHRAGFDDKTFHQLRHDCASLLLGQGIPMYAVSQILRHSSPTITARFYAHLTPELHREAADKMDGLLGLLVNRSEG